MDAEQQCERGRSESGGTESLHTSRRDEHFPGRREPAGHRAEAEGEDARQEDAPAAEGVGGAAERQHEAGDDDAIDRDGRRQHGGADVEAPADRGQCREGAGRPEHLDEEGRAQYGEGEAAPAGGGGKDLGHRHPSPESPFAALHSRTVALSRVRRYLCVTPADRSRDCHAS